MKKNTLKTILLLAVLLAASVATSERATASNPFCPPICTGR